MARHHVFDHIDSLAIRLEVFHRLSHRFAAQIFNSNAHMDADCMRPYCVVIPHPFNIPCTPRLHREPSEPSVGLIGYTKPPPSETPRLARAWNVSRLLREPTNLDQSCAFYDRLTVAIAWNTGRPDRQPAERFTSPISLGIPTIGYAPQASMAEYGDEFLCADSGCVASLIRRIHAGEMRRAFQSYRHLVARDVSWNATNARYTRLFRAVQQLPVSRNGTRPRAIMVPHNFSHAATLARRHPKA